MHELHRGSDLAPVGLDNRRVLFELESVRLVRDGKVSVRVFANRSAPVRVEILPIIDFLSAPLPPGNLVGLLAYEIRASHCDTTPLMQLPAEANLAIRYADSTVSGLNEGNLTVSRLDPSTNQWQAAPKLVREGDSNYVAASVMQLGTYTVSAP